MVRQVICIFLIDFLWDEYANKMAYGINQFDISVTKFYNNLFYRKIVYIYINIL